MCEASSHATMMDVCVNERGGAETSSLSCVIARVKVFTVTHFTSLVGSLLNIQRLEHSLVAHHLHNPCDVLKGHALLIVVNVSDVRS